MARIISIVNQKGGTGKSACTANLAVGLAQKNMKVLIVDADPQSDVSAGFGYRDCDDSNETLTVLMDAVMKDEDIPSDCYIRHQAEGIDIICSNIGLAGTEVQLVNAMSREYVLKQILYGIKDQYDAVIIDCIGSGNGGIISQLKMQNEMKLTDESWISYQQGKGNEEYQKYMEDLTDMQNHVLPYLQSFCSMEEKGVQERREQKIAEKNESRETVPRTGVEANTAVKDAGKAERKTVEQKKAMARKEKKPSIHERLEINKRIIQEKQGKDKPERGADLGVRTV